MVNLTLGTSISLEEIESSWLIKSDLKACKKIPLQNLTRMKINPGFLLLALTLHEAASSDFNFGDHAVDQCSNPIATVTNSGALNVFPPRDANGNCPNALCLGDCVTVIVDGGGSLGNSPPINIIIGDDLPDPGDCSTVAAEQNSPPGWDFTHNGMCGKGESGDGYWNNCFVHDVCVWARCV